MQLPTIFALDEANHELLSRSLPDVIVEQAQNFNKENTASRVVRRVAGDDGHSYLLFAPSMRMGRAHGETWQPAAGAVSLCP